VKLAIDHNAPLQGAGLHALRQRDCGAAVILAAPQGISE
jgi:hypothetical protein